MARHDNTRDLDWLMVCIYLGLVLTGWLMIYAVGYTPETSDVFDMSTRHGGQAVWIGVSIAVGFVIMLIDGKFFQTFAYPIYIAAILLLLYVLVAGRVVAGSKSWFDLGFFRFQPSEVAKFATCLALASFLGSYNVSLKSLRIRLIAIAFIVVPMAFILLQGDAGSALVFSSLFIVLYREGMPPSIYIIGITVALLSIVSLMFDDSLPIILGLIFISTSVLVYTFKTNRSKIMLLIYFIVAIFLYRYDVSFQLPTILGAGAIFIVIAIMKLLEKRRQLTTIMVVGLLFSIGYTWSVNTVFYNLKPHQQDRILVWLRPDKVDPLGALYNVTWSKRAIGSGGLAGKGFLQGTQSQLNFVPENDTDFIISVLAEEFGFVGFLALLSIYLLIVIRGFYIATQAYNNFQRYLAASLTFTFFIYVFVNVAMVSGILPVVGVPLPLVSYGGTSVVTLLASLGVLMSISTHRHNE